MSNAVPLHHLRGSEQQNSLVRLIWEFKHCTVEERSRVLRLYQTIYHPDKARGPSLPSSLPMIQKLNDIKSDFLAD